MPGGIEFKWFQDQQQGIQLLSTLNARKANQIGLPNREHGAQGTPARQTARSKIRDCVRGTRCLSEASVSRENSIHAVKPDTGKVSRLPGDFLMMSVGSSQV